MSLWPQPEESRNYNGGGGGAACRHETLKIELKVAFYNGQAFK